MHLHGNIHRQLRAGTECNAIIYPNSGKMTALPPPRKRFPTLLERFLPAAAGRGQGAATPGTRVALPAEQATTHHSTTMSTLRRRRPDVASRLARRSLPESKRRGGVRASTPSTPSTPSTAVHLLAPTPSPRHPPPGLLSAICAAPQ